MSDDFRDMLGKIQGEGKGSGTKPMQPQYRPVSPTNKNAPSAQTRQDDRQFKRQEDKGDARRNRGWNALLRVAVLCAALWGMYISAQFSVDGFQIAIDERAWIGWGLSIILIILESVWQKFPGNLTWFGIAVLCYGYGVTTNVLGILHSRGGFHGSPTELVVPIFFGLLLEIFPEPALAWSISGDTSSDPVRKLVEWIGKE